MQRAAADDQSNRIKIGSLVGRRSNKSRRQEKWPRRYLQSRSRSQYGRPVSLFFSMPLTLNWAVTKSAKSVPTQTFQLHLKRAKFSEARPLKVEWKMIKILCRLTLALVSLFAEAPETKEKTQLIIEIRDDYKTSRKRAITYRNEQ